MRVLSHRSDRLAHEAEASAEGEDSPGPSISKLLKLASGSDSNVEQEERIPSMPSSVSKTHKLILAVVGLLVLLAVMYFVVLRPLQRQVAAYNARGKQLHVLQTVLVDHGSAEHWEEVEQRKYGYFDETTYNVGIVIIAREMTAIANGQGRPMLRFTRLAYAFTLIFATVSIQILALVGTKLVVTPQQVASIRGSYDQYQVVMYGNHTVINQNGFHRGISGYFDPSAFASLDDDMKADVCQIPFSQLGFFGLILAVWSVICFAQFRGTIECFMNLIVFTDTSDSWNFA
jgi:hypothetical protein